jgi:hypothetical protein
LLIFALGILSLFYVGQRESQPSKTFAADTKIVTKSPLIIAARRSNNQIEYTVNNTSYSKRDLDELIGEARLNANPDSPVVVVLEDNMSLSDIKEVPQSALAAGFKNVRVFVYWKGTGNMAELFFGPVVKHNLDRLPN